MRDETRESDGVRVCAIVPAAGMSGRMGRPKQLLEVRGRPMVVGIVEALQRGGASDIVLVLNSAVRRQLQAQLPTIARVVVNDDPKTAMIDSVRLGLDSSGDSFAAYLICPADAAGIAAEDVRRCVDAFAETPDRIIIATHAGRRGHPMIFPKSMADVVRSSECDPGLNQLARKRPQLVRPVECDSPGTIANVNTPDDYERLE